MISGEYRKIVHSAPKRRHTVFHVAGLLTDEANSLVWHELSFKNSH